MGRYRAWAAFYLVDRVSFGFCGRRQCKIHGWGCRALLRRPPRGRSIWIVPNPLFVETSAGSSMKVPYRRFGKWKPLGTRHHVQSDPTLHKLSSFLGKRALMDYVRRAAFTNPDVVSLVEKWDSLTPAAQRAATLTDLCHVSALSRADFIGAAARGCCQAGDRCVLIALQNMELPQDVELAVCEWFA